MKYKNPVIPGFHPDPSICRVDNEFYLVTSSFEYFPEVPLFHSYDLIHWEQIGHCMEQDNVVTLRKGFPNMTGIYAPTIRFHNQTFYMLTTNVAYGGKDEGNFYISSKDPKKGWSKPIFIDMPGIDPSFYFEGNHAYYTGAHNNQIIFAEIDLTTGKPMHEPKYIWGGTGGNDPEGPHLYHKDGWYYLMISEGGTEYGHMLTIARSQNIDGPYTSCPANPVLTNRSHSLPIKSVGHGDLFTDPYGNWWITCLGVRTIGYPYRHNLGRETMLAPVTWSEDGWPEIGANGLLLEEFDLPDRKLLPSAMLTCPVTAGALHFHDDFSADKLLPCWNVIYQPDDTLMHVKAKAGQNSLSLKGNVTALSKADKLAWVGHRQEHHHCTVQTRLHFTPESENEEAGLTIYMNNRHHYELALTKRDGQNALIFRRQIGTLTAIENTIKIEYNDVIIRLEATDEWYTFSFAVSAKDTPDADSSDFTMAGQGECAYLTTEVGGFFTGNYIALYASGNGKPCTNEAVFDWFDYQARDEKK